MEPTTQPTAAPAEQSTVQPMTQSAAPSPANVAENTTTATTAAAACTKCESCLMPFSKDTGIRENPKYCSYCFKDGKLCYEGNNLKEFQKIVYKAMRDHGTNPILAAFYTWMIRFAPRWKK